MRSKHTPISVMERSGPIKRFFCKDDAEADFIETHLQWSDDSSQYAIVLNDAALVERLLQLENDLTAPDETPSHEADLIVAITLGRMFIVEKLAERTGAGLALDSVVANSGVTIEENTKFYQGVTVNGMEKKSWAKAPRANSDISHKILSPLLRAAHSVKTGALDPCSFSASNKPLESYRRFFDSHIGDKPLKLLERLPGGISQGIASFLNHSKDLSLQAAVIASQNVCDAIKYLLASMPETLEARSAKGQTTVEPAFQLR